MVRREEFPYLSALHINDAYAVKNIDVPIFQGTEFKHLILTGKNGSGKTTIIQSIATKIQLDVSSSHKHPYQIMNLNHWIEGNTDLNQIEYYKNELQQLQAVETIYYFSSVKITSFPTLEGVLIAFFPSQRLANIQPVESPKKEDTYFNDLAKPRGSASFAGFFKQYLVNKKFTQALAQIEGKLDKAQEEEFFFQRFEQQLRRLFSDEELKLEFISESYEFYLHYSDGRRTTFNQISAGFSAFLSILMDLLMRTDLLRKQINNYAYNPCGFVLIDEPETHLHLEMQYQILPLLTELFPNLQFIVATHSPAVASSIKNATVFDLSTREVLGDQAAGSSYSELMQTHFGLENEYSNVADDILNQVTAIMGMPDRTVASRKLRTLLEEQGKYMSPVLRLDVQAHLSHLEK